MRRVTIAIALGLTALACGPAPEVVQGEVTAYDAAAHRLVLADEAAPGTLVELDTASAEIGAEPAPGDVVRVAYRSQGGANRATRVMNISRQAEVGRPAGGH